MATDFHPYVGPRPFEQEEQHLFFGREREASELPSLIIAHKAVLLYAQSGAGKTSLLNTRVIPRLKEEGCEVLVARVHGAGIPRNIDLEQIANIYIFNALMNWTQEAVVDQLLQLFLKDFLNERVRFVDEGGIPRPRVIIFDQFEEFFTSYPERWENRGEFFEQVRDALNNDRYLRVVFVMREDYIASWDPYSAYLPERLRSYRLERLRKDGALLAVTGPLDPRFTERSYDENVADKLVDDLLKIRIKTESGRIETKIGEFVEPVQLQVVCQYLWESLLPEDILITVEHLQASGDVDEALTRFYERCITRVIQETGLEERELRIWFRDKIITSEGFRGTVHSGPVATAGIPNAAVDVLEELHIIRGEWQRGARWYELTHDRLIEPIQKSNTRKFAEYEQQEQQQLARASFVREVRRVAISLVIIMVVLMVGLALAEQARHAAEAIAATAQAETRGLSLAANARRELAADSQLAIALAVEAAQIAQPPGEVLRTLDEVVHARGPRYSFQGHTDDVRSVAISPDGRTILSGSADNTLILWNITTGDAIHRFEGHSGDVLSVAFSPDGQTALSGSADNTLIHWNLETGEVIHRLEGHEGAVWSVTFGPDGQLALSGSCGKITSDGSCIQGEMILWDVETGEEVRRFQGHTAAVSSVAFGSAGRTALSGSFDSTIRLWNVATGEEVRLFRGHTDAVLSVAVDQRGRYVLSGSSDASMILWDIEAGEAIRSFQARTEAVRSVAFSPDGQSVLSGSSDGTLMLWDMETRENIGTFQSHTAGVNSVVFSPDGAMALSGSDDNTLILWDLIDTSGGQIRTFAGHSGGVPSVTFSPDGRTVLSGSHDGMLILWDVETGAQIRRFQGHSEGVISVAFSPDGQRALSGSADATLILWDVETGAQIRRFQGHSEGVISVAFSPDGQRALSGSADATLILWDVETRAQIRRFQGHTGGVNGVAFSPDGHTALSGSTDNTLILWNLETGAAIRHLAGHEDRVNRVTFSPDGQTAISASSDGALILWDVNVTSPTFGEGIKFVGHTKEVIVADFSPDGQAAISASSDGTLILWDVDVTSPTFGEAIRSFHSDRNSLWSVAFSPDGETAISGSSDGKLTLWDVATASLDELMTWARTNRIVPTLTCGEREEYLAATCTPTPRFSPTPTATILLGPEDQALAATATQIVIEATQTEQAIGTAIAQAMLTVAAVPTATPVQIALGESVSGLIEPGSHDWWTFEGQAGQIITITMGQYDSYLDSFVTLRGPNDQVLISNDDGGQDLNAMIASFALPIPGNYTILARGYGDSAGSYILTLVDVTETTATPLPTFTPSATFAPFPVIGEIVFGEPVSGVIELDSYDRWMFEGRAGQIVTIAMSENNSDLDPVITVFGPTGRELAHDDDSGSELNAAIFDFILPETGLYIIEGRGYNGTAGAYTLTLTDLASTTATPSSTPSPTPTLIAPSPTPPPLFVGEIVFDNPNRGYIESGSYDRWTFEGQAGQLITITMREDNSGLDSFLNLFGPGDVELVSDDDSGFGLNAEISDFSLPETGIYTVRASGVGNSAGSYTLRITDLTTTTATPSPTVSPSPSPSPTSIPDVIGEIAFGESVNGVITSGSSHRWTFEGQTGQHITITMSETDDSGLDPILTLLGPNDQELASDDDGGYEGLSALLADILLRETGNYAIIANGFGSSAGAYTLGINDLTSTTATPTQTLTPTWTPFPTSTPFPTPIMTPVAINTPTAMPETVRTAGIGVQRGEIEVGGREVWIYDGQAGEVLSINVIADWPARDGDQKPRVPDGFDTMVIVYSPDDSRLAENDDIVNGMITNSYVEALRLPVRGEYQIEIRSWQDESGGTYLLVIGEIESTM